VNRLQMGRAADELAGVATVALKQHRNNLADTV
jgi:hypothetical protein